MKKSLAAVTVFLSLFCACSPASNGSSKANTQNPRNMNGKENSKLPVEESINGLRLSKVEMSRTGQITVQLENSSAKPVRIWKDSNSWGAACWRLLLIRNGRLDIFFENPDQDFTKNAPTFNEITAGGRIEQKLNLNGGNWCGMGHCSLYNERGFGGKEITFETNDIVIVVYDVPSTQEARNLGIWYGVIAATATVQ